MSILPSFLEAVSKIKEEKEVLKVPKEYGIDFSTGQLTGKIVEGLEAIKVWVWLCLHTERFRHAIYSADYGTSLEQYFGRSLTDEYISTDCESEISEALLVNKDIQSIEDFLAEKEGESLKINFKLITKFGDLEVGQDVRR